MASDKHSAQSILPPLPPSRLHFPLGNQPAHFIVDRRTGQAGECLEKSVMDLLFLLPFLPLSLLFFFL
jgi:hypothetical protein